MTPRERYDQLLQRITTWAIAEECGVGKMPQSQRQVQDIATRVSHTIERAKLFHVEPERHVKQSWFLKAKAPITVAHTGNKFGKTFALLIRGLVASLGCAPWAPDDTNLYNPLTRWVEEQEKDGELIPAHWHTYEPPIRVTLIVQDYATSLPEDIIPRLKEIIPWDALVTRTSRVQGNVIDSLEFWNGSTWKILSHVQPPERYEGWSTHLCLWNEPFPRSIWIAANRGCVEFNAPHLMAFTPISEAWIYDEIYLPAFKVKSALDFARLATEKPGIVVVEGTIYDNKYLPDEAVKRFEALLNPQERSARLLGEWQHFAGRVYKNFSRERHVRELRDLVGVP